MLSIFVWKFSVGELCGKPAAVKLKNVFFEQLVFMEISRGNKGAEVRFWTSLELLH